MQVNLPVWKYYEPGFIDPLYAPYQKQSMYMPNGPDWYQYPQELNPLIMNGCNLNPTQRDNISPGKPSDTPIDDRSIWNKNPDTEVSRADINYRKTEGCCDNLYPELMRVGWGTSFQLKHPMIDACPPGYTKTVDGWCHRVREEYEPIFYTDKGPTFRNTNFYGYAEKPTHKCLDGYDRGDVNWKGGYSWSSMWANPQTRPAKPSYYSAVDRDTGKYANLPTKFSYV